MNLTKEEIEALPAGRELDALVAKYVYGYEYLDVGYWQSPKNGIKQLPSQTETPERQLELEEWLRSPSVRERTDNAVGEYWIDAGRDIILHLEDFSPSTELGTAWEVVEFMNKTHYLSTSQYWVEGGSDGGVLGFRFTFERFKTYEGETAAAETAPLALCRAALFTMLIQLDSATL
jgi:hypothetical protein